MQQIDYMEYPKPQLRRDKYYILDGDWKCCDRLVRVPFPLQSVLSGFDEEVPDKFTYEREFTVPKDFTEDRIILHRRPPSFCDKF